MNTSDIIMNLNAVLNTAIETIDNLACYHQETKEKFIADMEKRYSEAFEWVESLRNIMVRSAVCDRDRIGLLIFSPHRTEICGRAVFYTLPNKYDYNFGTACVDGGHEMLDAFVYIYENERSRYEKEFSEFVIEAMREKAENLNRKISALKGE